MQSLPAPMMESLRAWDGTVAPTRDAATVVVLRQAADGLEAFLMRRPPSMLFAAGMYVFPGGSVQESDYGVKAWIGPPPQIWADRFSCGPDLAAALVVAAAREVFEETGILFAGPDDTSVLGELAGEEWAQARLALEQNAITFAELLLDRHVSLRTDLMGAWAHWITPEFEPRRFDTRFFVALLPAGQAVGRLSTEAETGTWMSVSEAWRAAERGEMAMLPPTRHTLAELAGVQGASILETAARREISTVLPAIVEVDGNRSLIMPEPPTHARGVTDEG